MIVKICGITNIDDAMAAVDSGADMLGFVFARSPRRVGPQTAREVIRNLPPGVDKVGVFVDEQIEHVREIADLCSLNYVQLHGLETPEYARELSVPFIKAFRLKDESVLEQIEAFGADKFLIDSYDPNLSGGTGKTADFRLAARAAELGDAILAGGLNPENVAEAILKVKPYGVDVSSGVELRPGRKDHEKVKTFIAEAKSCHPS
ncbi:MAG: phosphoribosylanthranilate isomerase [Planctomycetota bacterium]|nr:MAG: phosphoribosylanthranilate isomerase [Planctomycetota bacterium]